VLIADDDEAHRRDVRVALEADGFVVVAESGAAETAISAAARVRPDICLLEIGLPGDGPAAVGRIAKASPDTLIVVLSRSNRPEDVVLALMRGASGYLLKGISGERLAFTLRGAYSGEPPLSRSLVPHIVEEIHRGSERRLLLPTGAVSLTPREWEVGELLRKGQSTAEIAERLGVSPVTVRRHIGLLLHKLDAKSRADAAEMFRVYSRR
jgi:DNA-binding NarL/FixJ family response regulator